MATYKLYKKTSDTAKEEIQIPASSVSGLAKVATSGSYNDLSNKPTMPTNYVTTDTDQAIKGKKTVIPPANKDNSNQIATTAWAGRRYKSIADFGFTSQTTVKAIVQKIIDNWYEYCTFACTNDNFNNFSDTPDGYGTLIIEVGSNALRPLISFTKQIGDSNSYKNWQANIVQGENNQVTEIQWYEIINSNLPQTISGAKTFTNNILCSKNYPIIDLRHSLLTHGAYPSETRSNEIRFLDKDDYYEGGIRFDTHTDGTQELKIMSRSFGTTYISGVTLRTKNKASSANEGGAWILHPSTDGSIDLGASSKRWRDIRAVTTYSNVYGSDLCSTGSLRLKDPNIIKGTNQAANGGKKNYYRAININDKNDEKGVAVEWGYLCAKDADGNTTVQTSEINLLAYQPNTTGASKFTKLALGKKFDGSTYLRWDSKDVALKQDIPTFSLSGTTLTITL